MSAEISLPSGYHLVRFDTLESTNDEAKRLARSGAADGTVVWARTQTAGRGRRERIWNSEPGNLFCSVLVDPGCPPAQAMQLSFVAAVALADIVEARVPRGTPVECKWPNDVLINGRKAAGILLELVAGHHGGRLVVGIGVNAAHAPDIAGVAATSLAAEGCSETDPGRLLEGLCRRFAHWRGRWSGSGFAPVRAAWLTRAKGIGAPLTVRLARESFHGTFAGLDEDGALLVAAASGVRRVASGEVFHPGP